MAITTTLDKVRLEIGDTDSTAPLFYDVELNYIIDTYGPSVLKAAAAACDVLATRYARAYDFETDQQKFTRSQMHKMYADRAKELRTRAQGLVTATVTKVDGFSDDVDSRDVGVSGTNPRRNFYGDPDAIP